MTRKQLIGLAALLMLATLPALASAQSPWGGFGGLGGYGGFGNGFGNNAGYGGYGYNYGVGYVAPPPYFSLFPPVYYSGEIVRRPYGSSPFAYPSWYERPSAVSYSGAAVAAQSAPPQPLLIENPYVKSAAPAAAGASATPEKIVNPFAAR